MGAASEGLPPDPGRRLPTSGWLTDDTQLTVATCEAIVEARGVDPEVVARRMACWYQQRRVRAPGASTLKALRDLDAGAHWALAGARGEFAAGAGAAMRAAPLAWMLDLENSSDRGIFRDVCRITHHNEEAYAGALAFSLALREMTKPHAPELRQILASTPDSRVRDRLKQIFKPEGLAIQPPQSGHCAELVPFAISIAFTVHDAPLADALRVVIRAGGDTDTAGALVGALIGSRHGTSATRDLSTSGA